ncbi:hypothetical protein [Clostridium sp.]|uniref:hypothetical protein n=1 Tax=Clostridium sp. TaxID=1506 RepID=UPI002A9208EF|nr:hypothetical protein [Clostridium sp.]MDY6013102.1 hypothetical protein [Clostridium sp.]
MLHYVYPDGDFFFNVNERANLEFDRFIELDNCYRNKKEKSKESCGSNKKYSCEKSINSNKEFHLDNEKWSELDEEYSKDMTCK